MADRSVKLLLTADVKGLTAGLKTGAQATKDFSRDLNSWAKKNEQHLDTVGKGAAVMGAGMLASFAAASKAAMSWESDWTGVLKTVNGTPAQLGKVEDGLRDLAKTLPSSHTEIAAVAEAAGQLGIATGDVVGFTRVMIDLGQSTNLSAEDAATSLARFSNVMGTNNKDVGRLGATLVGLGNNFATTESEIMALSMRLAGAGKQVNLTEGQTMGLAAAMSSVGIEAEAGGSAMSLTMKRIGKSVDEGDAKLGLFAGTAGMTSEQFQKAWKDDAGSALEAFVLGLGRAGEQGASVNGILTELGITGIREADSLLRLSSAGELMGKGMKAGGEEFLDGTALVEEAMKRYDTAESRVAIAWNNIKDAAIEFGDAFLPMIADAADGVSSFAQFMGNLPAPIQGAAMAFAGLGGAAALVGGGLITVLPKVRDTVDAFNALAPSGSKARGALLGVGRAAGAVAGAFVILQGLEMLRNSPFEDEIPNIEGYTQALLGMGTTADTLNAKFATNGGLGTQLDTVGDALARVADTNWYDSFSMGLAGMFGLGSPMQEFTDRVKGLDESLAVMATSGNTEMLSEKFKLIAASAAESGLSAEETAAQLPQMMEALRGLANETGEFVPDAQLLAWVMGGEMPPAMAAAGAAASGAAGEMGELGAEAETTAASLDDILDSLFALGVVTMDSRSATAALEGSLDDARATAEKLAGEAGGLGEALNKNASDFDLTTQAGRDANAAFQDVAKTGMAEFEAKAREGAGTKELQKSLKGTYEGLLTTLDGFGINGQAAEDLARDILGIPDDVSVKSWMSDAAKRTAEGTKEAVDNIPGSKNIAITTTYVYKQQGKPQNPIPGAYQVGVGWPGKATGGPIFGPGTGTSDDIPAMLSNGEHVLTAKEVQALGGHGSVERMRGLAKAGLLPAFAKGGRVGWSKRDQSADLKRLRGATADRKQEERDQKAAQKAYDRIDGTKENRAAKKAAKRRLDAAKKATERAKKAEAAAKREYEDAKARTGRLSEGAFDLRRDVKRGDIRESVMSGNGMSVVDRLFDASKNEDLSKRQRNNLYKTAVNAEKQLLKLEKQAEKLDKQLDSAKAKEQELRAVKNQTRDAIIGTFDLNSLRGQKNEWGYDQAVTKGSLLSYGKQKAKSAKKLKNVMSKLQKAGFRPELMQQVIDEWTGSGTFEIADALLSMNTSERQQINQLYEDTSRYGYQAGHRLTEAMHEGGLHAAEGLRKGLEDKQNDLNKTMTKLAKGMEKALRKAWGIASPSKVMRGLMHHLGDGAVLGLEDKAGEVSAATAAMVTEPKFGGWSVNSGSSARSMSAPVMELSAADRALMSEFIHASQAMPDMKLMIGNREAAMIVQEGTKAARRLQ